jgi:hypothetical protein
MHYATKKLFPVLILSILISSNTTHSMEGPTKTILFVIGVFAGMALTRQAIQGIKNNNGYNATQPHLFQARFVKHNEACEFIINEDTGATYQLDPKKEILKATTHKHFWDIMCNKKQGSSIRVDKKTHETTFYEGNDIVRPPAPGEPSDKFCDE